MAVPPSISIRSSRELRTSLVGIYYYALAGPVPVAAPLLGWLCNVGGTKVAFEVAGGCALAVTAVAAVVVRRGPQGAGNPVAA